MGCIPARTCKAALAEASLIWRGRSTASDGVCASPQHHNQNPSSDHELGNAFDLTHDPNHGLDSYALADWLRLRALAGLETRVKYIISNHRIFNPSVSPAWRSYSGSNPHTKHMHVSINANARDDTRSWWEDKPGGNQKMFQMEGSDNIYELVGSHLEYVNATSWVARGKPEPKKLPSSDRLWSLPIWNPPA